MTKHGDCAGRDVRPPVGNLAGFCRDCKGGRNSIPLQLIRSREFRAVGFEIGVYECCWFWSFSVNQLGAGGKGGRAPKSLYLSEFQPSPQPFPGELRLPQAAVLEQ